MKYIVTTSLDNVPAAILFAESLTHKDVAGNLKVSSAGFCNALGDVWGHSESLGIKSNPKDSKHVVLALTMTLNPKP